jgi:HTH-type transcriptional regulator/antitoxin HigA
MTKFLIDDYDDFFVTSGNNESILESYKISQEKLKILEPKYRNDDSVRLELLKETYSQKTSNTLYRKNGRAKDTLVTLWLSKVKTLAYLYYSLNTIPKFDGISKDELLEISSLNSDASNLNHIEEILAQKGIVLVIDYSIKGLNTDGAVYKLDSGTPVIAMSLRYSRYDNFWFTLMHELSHICLHYDSLDDVIIDDFNVKSEELIERQANKLAGDLLIPRSIWRSCLARKDLQDKSIMSFAQKHNIHPAIVAGRINKERDKHDKFSKIINQINVRDTFIHE